MSYLFSSESVCAGHPDKICDQISDAIVDAALEKDAHARVAVETLVTQNLVVLAGEVSCEGTIDYERIAREVIAGLGYVNSDWGFSDKSRVLVEIHQQSRDIGCGVDEGGAGDQGLMFGYACRQTEALMPVPIMVAHGLAEAMDTISEQFSWMRPDGKVQVTAAYEQRECRTIDRIVLARPHSETVEKAEVDRVLYQQVVAPVLERYGFAIDMSRLIVNGTGRWDIGGPAMDSGLTGRKIMVDSYGGWSRQGGGAFSGKDATKVDRSAAYMARWVAKQVVAEQLAKECEIQVAYVIGQPEPVSVMIETFGTEKKESRVIADFVASLSRFEVKEMIERLELRKPRFFPTAVYGHFGRPEFIWEQIG